MGRVFEDIALQTVAMQAKKKAGLFRRIFAPPGIFEEGTDVKVLYVPDLDQRLASGRLGPPGTLLVPASPNYPAVDAVAVRGPGDLVGLQVTIAEKHELDAAKCLEIYGAQAKMASVERPKRHFEVRFVVPWFRVRDYRNVVQAYKGTEAECKSASKFVQQGVFEIVESDFVAELQRVPEWRTRGPEPAQEDDGGGPSRKRPREA